jgi:hypothetical protein
MRFLLLVSFWLTSLVVAAQNTEQPDPLRPSSADTTQTIVDSTGTSPGLGQDRSKVVRTGDTLTYRVRLTADGTLTSGNINRSLQLVGAFDVTVSKLAKLSSTPSFVYGRQNNTLAEREYFGDARVTLLHQNRLYYLAFGSYEQSNLRQIMHRYTLAAGIGYKLVDRKRAYISITNVLLREYTDFASLNDINTFRNSARLFGEYTFGHDRWTLSHTAFYQPALNRSQEGEPRNVRWNGNVSIQYKFSTYLSLRSTLANSYESIVVPGRVNDDLRLTLGMTYEKK